MHVKPGPVTSYSPRPKGISPYDQSVFADAVDAVQAVALTFDALINEVG